MTAVVAGLLFRLAFPPICWWPCVAAGMALFLAALAHTGWPFVTGMLFQGAFTVSLCAFLVESLRSHFGLGWLPTVAFVVTVAGVVPGWWCGLFARLAHRRVRLLACRRWRWREAGLVAWLAALFVVTAWLRTTFSPEQGWAETGMAFYRVPALLWPAAFFGSGIFAALAILSGACWWRAGMHLLAGEPRPGLMLLAAPVAATAVTWGIDSWRKPRAADHAERHLPVALVHPGITQDRRWRDDTRADNLAVYRQLSRAALRAAPQPQLVVWPETALTYCADASADARRTIRDLTAAGDWLLIGAPAATGTGDQRRYYNAATLYQPGGTAAGAYHKVILLPFTERRFAGIRIATGKVAYSAGSRARILTMRPADGGTFALAPLICFEIAAPRLARQAARAGAEVLAHLSNDAWFGASSQSEQQLAQLVLRCVEHGTAGIRCTGYGVAAAVAPNGRILAQSTIAERTVLHVTIPVPVRPRTLQTRFPDWFVLLCVLVAAAPALPRATPATAREETGAPRR